MEKGFMKLLNNIFEKSHIIVKPIDSLFAIGRVHEDLSPIFPEKYSSPIFFYTRAQHF